VHASMGESYDGARNRAAGARARDDATRGARFISRGVREVREQSP
jgi:hypothetical protein